MLECSVSSTLKFIERKTEPIKWAPDIQAWPAWLSGHREPWTRSSASFAERMQWRPEHSAPAPWRCKLVFRRRSLFENGTCSLSSPRLRCSAGVRSVFGVPPLRWPGHLDLRFRFWCGAFVAQYAQDQRETTASSWVAGVYAAGSVLLAGTKTEAWRSSVWCPPRQPAVSQCSGPSDLAW